MPHEPLRDYVGEVLAEVPGTAEYKAALAHRGATAARSGNGKVPPVFPKTGTEQEQEQQDDTKQDHQRPQAPATPKDPPWKQSAFTAEELQRMKFEPTSFMVEDIIPTEGVALLCSKPKFGKSWLAFDLCIGCTMNRFILGEIKPAQGDVLYLALEDSRRRLHRRMCKLLPPGTPWPAKLTLQTKWRRLHEGGLEDLRAWHRHTEDNGGKPILIVIDVLAMVRKPSGNKQLYEADYEALTGLTHLAAELGLAIVVIHHTRKMASDDLMETISGSFGISGAVDTILVMAKKAAGAVLDVRGRDVESRELAIEFNKNSCRWRILGMAPEVHASDQRARVLVALQGADEGLAIAEIMVAAQLPNRNAADILLHKMTTAEEIERIKRGVYGLPGTLAKLAAKNTERSERKKDRSLN
jgi:AAA domain-containing protein